SYADLAGRADGFAAEHLGFAGAGKRLVLLQMRNDMASVVRYMGALRAGHAVLLTGDDLTGKGRHLIERYRPDICVPASGGIVLSAGAEPVHPDLALCLSTSGSTGATKLVRLSAGAIDANARSIADYLELQPGERAITTLPLYYSYGLSVLHSHLACGSAVIMTERSLTDPVFWDIFRREGATSLAGVPHSFELLDAVGFADMELPSLRTVTQAGGRLSPDVARRYGAWALGSGRRMFVMYGQTEAAPRMAYLPPERLLEHADCIGVPVPDGAFALLDEDGRTLAGDGVTGELVYRGPNVMMGYAFDRDDLAKGQEVEALATGDLAERRGDLYRIVGRKSRFCKPFGLRISLDEVEAALARRGVTAAVAGNDDLIAIACQGDMDGGAMGPELAREFELPAALFDVAVMRALPRLSSGKTDYQRILQAALARRQAAVPMAEGESIAETFGALLHRPEVAASDSFVTLEGDSLSYVAVASALDQRLGYLPEGWENLTVAQIDALTPQAAATAKALKPYDSEMLLRAVAITGVVANHASADSGWHVAGGADVLMLLVGFNLARFNFGRLTGGQSFDVLLSVIRRIILPYCLILWAYALFYKDVSASSFLLVSNFEGRFQSFLTPYWFMEALFQCMILLALLFRMAPVRQAAASDPYVFGLWLLGGTVALKAAAFAIFHHDRLQSMTPDAVLPLIACGWLLFFARTPGRKAVALVVAFGFTALHVAVPALGGWDYASVGQYRLVWLLVTIIALLYVPRISLPPLLAKAINAVAAASFTIYLIHVLPVHVMKFQLNVDNAPLIVAVAMAAGMAVHAIRPRRLIGRMADRINMRKAAPAMTD
ncbi:MAG: AMP-binding protein, partial [Alphaproteobacteria bacterium]|nr:AMP-binding protein [Alphaproteobacteria bacterium]